MTINRYAIIHEEPNIVEFKDGDEVFGKVEEITSRDVGASRANIAKVTLWGPDVLHYHREAEETYICLEGDGELFLDGKIFNFSPGTRAIIGPWIRHAARPEKGCKELVLLCVASPAFHSDDVYEDKRRRKW